MHNILLPLIICVSTLCTPYDDAQTAILDFLSTAKQQILIAGYTITNPYIINKLIDLHNAGVDIEIITDTTQASGKYERIAIQQLVAHGIPVLRGKSSYHQLMHAKFIVLDGIASEDGSYNYTVSANYQDNIVHINNDKQLAHQLYQYWQQIKQDLR